MVPNIVSYIKRILGYIELKCTEVKKQRGLYQGDMATEIYVFPAIRSSLFIHSFANPLLVFIQSMLLLSNKSNPSYIRHIAIIHKSNG